MIDPVLQKIRIALGRSADSPVAAPPNLDEHIIRLVHSNIGLPELFIRRACDNHIRAVGTRVEELIPKLIEFLNTNACHRLCIGQSGLLDRLGIAEALKKSGFEVANWADIPRDSIYDFDCGITDVWRAVAETGSLVVKASKAQGRSVSLVPLIHIAIVEPANFVPDLFDLFADAPDTTFSIISAPSKTADIEMTMVEGVHGPRIVQAFVLT